jgi:hypothetical protein
MVAAINNLAAALLNKPEPAPQPQYVAPKPEGSVTPMVRNPAPMARLAKSSVTPPSADGTVGQLEILNSYPKNFNSEAAAIVCQKATAWRQSKGLPEGSVTVVIQRSAYGKLSCRFFQNTTKAPANCVGAIGRF